MNKLENLTKENFWNDLKVKYPLGVQAFCDWVDEYKKVNNWDELFNEGDSDGDDSYYRKSPKYHDLPLAFQLGIFAEFILTYGLDPEPKFIAISITDIQVMISSWIEVIDLELKRNIG